MRESIFSWKERYVGRVMASLILIMSLLVLLFATLAADKPLLPTNELAVKDTACQALGLNPANCFSLSLSKKAGRAVGLDQ